MLAGAVFDVPGFAAATPSPAAPPATPGAAIGVSLIDSGLVWVDIVLVIAVDLELLDRRRLGSRGQKNRCGRIEDRRPSHPIRHRR